MDVSDLRDAIVATPFIPFTIHLADGRAIPVFARDFIILSPVNHLATVFQKDGKYDLITTSLITGLSYDAPVPLTSTTP